MSIKGDFVWMNELLYVYHTVYPLLFSPLLLLIPLSSTVAASSLSYLTSSSSTSLSRRHYQLKGKVGKVSDGYILIKDVRG